MNDKSLEPENTSNPSLQPEQQAAAPDTFRSLRELIESRFHTAAPLSSGDFMPRLKPLPKDAQPDLPDHAAARKLPENLKCRAS